MKQQDLLWLHDKITRRYQSKKRHLLRAEAKHVQMPMRSTNDEIVHLQGALESLRAVIEILEEHMNSNELGGEHEKGNEEANQRERQKAGDLGTGEEAPD